MASTRPLPLGLHSLDGIIAGNVMHMMHSPKIEKKHCSPIFLKGHFKYPILLRYNYACWQSFEKIDPETARKACFEKCMLNDDKETAKK